MADLVVLNTCHIREKAAEKVYSDIGRLTKAGAKEGKTPMIAVAGCVAQAEGEEIMARAPAVGMVVGPQAYHRLPDLIDRAVAGERATDTDMPPIAKFAALPARRTTPPAAFLTIAGRVRQVLHLLRGALYARRGNIAPVQRHRGRSATAGRSRRARDHAAGPECQRLVGRGRSGPHGRAGGPRPRAGEGRWACPHPLHHQPPRRHGRRADRRAWRGEGADALSASAGTERQRPRAEGDEPQPHRRQLSANCSNVSAPPGPTWRCRGDFIVGFPGETDAEFEETLALVDTVGYAQAYSFKYSPRPGTPAATMDGQVPREVMDERLQRLQARSTATSSPSTAPAWARPARCWWNARASWTGNGWANRRGCNRSASQATAPSAIWCRRNWSKAGRNSLEGRLVT